MFNVMLLSAGSFLNYGCAAKIFDSLYTLLSSGVAVIVAVVISVDTEVAAAVVAVVVSVDTEVVAAVVASVVK